MSVTRSESKEFGKLSRMFFGDKLAYIWKKGWTIRNSDGAEITLAYKEINEIIKETAKRGYART